MTEHVSIQHDRVAAVAEAFAALGADGITRFDETEPEYAVFQTLVDEYGSSDAVYLLGVCAGVVDYQLDGNAQQFWEELQVDALAHGRLTEADDVQTILDRFMERSVNGRLNGQKRARLRKLFGGRFADWFVHERHETPPKRTWIRLAHALDSEPQKKTIVFAMKVYDIVHLVDTGEYLAFPSEMPIPYDLQIERVTETAGLLPPGEYTEDIVHDAWGEVMDGVNERIGREVSILRVDSIVWQLGQIIGTKTGPRARADVESYLVDEVGLSQGDAARLATELTYTRD